MGTVVTLTQEQARIDSPLPADVSPVRSWGAGQVLGGVARGSMQELSSEQEARIRQQFERMRYESIQRGFDDLMRQLFNEKAIDCWANGCRHN